jgi:hypothetical protein
MTRARVRASRRRGARSARGGRRSLQEDANKVALLMGAIHLGAAAAPVHSFCVHERRPRQGVRRRSALSATRSCAGRSSRSASSRRIPAGKRLTDFNDLHAAEGLAAVEKQIADALGMATTMAARRSSPRSSRRRKRSSRSPRSIRPTVRPGGAGAGGPERPRMEEALLGDGQPLHADLSERHRLRSPPARHRAAAAHAPDVRRVLRQPVARHEEAPHREPARRRVRSACAARRR